MHLVPEPHTARLRYIAVSACLTAMLLAGLLGYVAAALYMPMVSNPKQPPSEWGVPQLPNLGAYWGALTGLIAGLIWCRIVFPKYRHDPRAPIRRVAAEAGGGVGVLSCTLLHVVLMIAAKETSPLGLVVGCGFAIPSGMLLGFVCGHLFPEGSASPSDLHEENQIDRSA